MARRGSTALTDPEGEAPESPRLGPIFLACLAALVAMVAFSLLAASIVQSLYPDLPERVVFEGLPGLLALTIASSVAFVLTAVIASGGSSLASLRLRSGVETGSGLLLMVVGTLALGQVLDSLTTLAGLADQGNMELIRKALARAAGPELFLAVLVVGVLAGTAEEIFFRGYMQTRLVQRLPRAAAIGVTAVCFGLFHMDPLHGLLALILGLYLGWITELTGSALPAVTCHVVNNAVFTILTAAWGPVSGVAINIALAAAAAVVFAGCVAWLRHASPATPAEAARLSTMARHLWKRLRR